MFRLAFDFEKQDCEHRISLDEPGLNDFLQVDKSDQLMKIKDEVVEELTSKFLGTDVKVVNAMKEVLNDHFQSTDNQLNR